MEEYMGCQCLPPREPVTLPFLAQKAVGKIGRTSRPRGWRQPDGGKGERRSQKQMEAGGEEGRGLSHRREFPGMRPKDPASEYLLPGHFRSTFFSQGL